MFRVTYSVVTPESAEHGDFDRHGYTSPGGWTHDDPAPWSLREIVSRFGRNSLEDSGSWFSTIDPDIDYRTGEDTSYSVHPSRTITAASYARIARVLAYQQGGRS